MSIVFFLIDLPIANIINEAAVILTNEVITNTTINVIITMFSCYLKLGGFAAKVVGGHLV
jgi:hypothetical protein